MGDNGTSGSDDVLDEDIEYAMEEEVEEDKEDDMICWPGMPTDPPMRTI